MDNAEIRDFSFDYWDEYVNLINQHWSPNHPIVNLELFKWQYGGFLNQKGVANSKLLFINNKLEGFRGVIPVKYQLNNQIIDGVSFAVWIVSPECRGKGFGYSLMKLLSEEFRVLTSLGSNLSTSVPIYLKNGFQYIDSLNRYIVPLNLNDYKKLIQIDYNEVLVNEIGFKIVPNIPPLIEYQLDALELENRWNRFGFNNFFSVNRSKEYWDWRYINSVGFNYFSFIDDRRSIVFICRRERVEPRLFDKSIYVLRIIEILPNSLESLYPNTLEFKQLKIALTSLLNWASLEGYAAADYQISNNRFEHLLTSVGFILQNHDYSPKEASLAGLFHPFRLTPPPINGTWKIVDDSGQQIFVDRNNTYFVKSDNDMDRPNVLPPLK